MPVEFTRAQLEAVATLAQLELDPSEVELFARQLGEILGYADQVRQIDTTGVPPTAHVVTRHDEQTAAIFATNSWNPETAGRVAFAYVSDRPG